MTSNVQTQTIYRMPIFGSGSTLPCKAAVTATSKSGHLEGPQVLSQKPRWLLTDW